MNQFDTKWERFYTNSKAQSKEDLVDKISIDVVNKEYLFFREVDDAETDGEDENGNEIYFIYVSREIFEIILQGLKFNGYNQAEPEKPYNEQ